MSAGAFGQGKVPTESGKAFDAAVNGMRNTITSLTRVPGVGAMSDYETKLSQASMPNREEYESVTQQQIDQVAQLIQTLEDGYASLAPEPAAKPRDFSQVTESDIDSMSPEELKAFLAQ
jgi:ribosomal protein S13